MGALEVQNHPQEPQEQVQDILELMLHLFSSKSDHRSPSYGHLKVYGSPLGSIGTSYRLYKDLIRSL